MSAEECSRCLFPALRREVEEKDIVNACYSFDRATPHESAAPRFGWQPGSPQRTPLASASPDMNKVVEHAIGRVKQAFWEELMKEGTWGLTAAKAQKLLQQVALSAVAPASVLADAESLVTTMQVIAAPKGSPVAGPNGWQYEGTAGSWPPRELR